MAKDKINDVNKAGKDIKNTFSEIGNLINELNSSLEKTLSLTKGVSDNLSQSGDLTKEFMDSEANVKNLKENVANLDNDKLKKLQNALKTGKDLRFRPEFRNWKAKLLIRYDADRVTVEQVANLLNHGGQTVGVGEWRPEKNGTFGMFQVVE